jgi:glycosyltransferase involved in cell wall biosynthesis
MNKISVIVPVYNVERYISRCATSLFEQTLADIEYVFVNDCTQDKSIDELQNVINQYPNRRNSVKIINHDTNKGLGFARTTGVNNAEGEYIIHCDSDDWLSKDACEKMYNTAKETDADIVWCDFFLSNNGNEQYISQANMNDNVVVLKDMLATKMWWNLAGRCYKREFYLSTNASVTKTARNGGEDMITMILFYYAENVKHLPEAFYHYDISSQSAMTSVLTKNKIQSYVDSICEVEDFLRTKDDYANFASEINYLKCWLKYLILYSFNTRKELRWWCDLFAECNPYMAFKPNTGKIQRFIACLTLRHIFSPVIVRNRIISFRK